LFVSGNQDMINQLKEYEKNSLDDWYDLEDSEQKSFLRALANYIESNKTTVKDYCSTIDIKEFSSLSIIYEAASVYSFSCNDFILDEVKRVIELVKKNNLKPKRLEILEDFELEDLYEKEYSTYCQVLDYLIDSLSISQSNKLNIAILNVIDYYLIDSDEEDAEYKKWEEQLVEFGNRASEEVKSHIAEKNKTTSKSLKKSAIIWQILFFVGLFSQITAISLFRKTVIETTVSIGLYLIIGTLGLLVFNKQLKVYAGNFFYRVVFSVVSFGGTFVALFLFLNLEYASEQISLEKYEILEKSSLPGSKHHRSERKPTVYIMLDGLKKEIVYPYSMTTKVDEAQYLMIKKSEGLFGFDVIRSKKLE